MSDQTNAMYAEQDERTILVAKARKMGIKFQPAISTDKLRARIEEVENPSDKQDRQFIEKPKGTSLKELRDAAKKLVRVQLTCLDPSKKDYPGEYFTTGNTQIGIIKRMIPYHGEPWHIEAMLLNSIQNKVYTKFVKKKDPITGETSNEGVDTPMFHIQVLPPLSEKELKDLAADQRNTGRV